MLKSRRLSPALVIALVALFVSMSGTAVAAGVVPLAKRALFANNAGKLQGKSVRQISALPGPASTAASLVSSASSPFSLAPEEEKDFSAQCPAGAKAVSGGFTSPNVVLASDTHPTSDGAGWTVYLINLSASASAAGNVQAVCVG